MNLIWSHEDTQISGIVSAKFSNQSLLVSGTGKFKDRFFEWQAAVTSEGWYITIPGRGSSQGSTFNLQLEVASAVRRIL